jgi:hypothetical protein
MRLAATLAIGLLGWVSVAAETPAERASRAAAIRSTAESIVRECQRDAGGDWDRWYASLAGFRSDLQTRLDAARARQPAFKADPDHAPNALLRADYRPPLYDSPDNAAYLAPMDPAGWAKARPSGPVFMAVSEWLRRRNIDLILVPVPRIAEVYADHIVTGVPSDKIVAPHLRKFFLDLLNAGVEVVDLLPGFLKARDTDPEPLYLLTDGHWSDRAQRMAATEIGRRLKRYDVVKAALARPPLFTIAHASKRVTGAAWDLITPAERTEVEDAIDATRFTTVTTRGGAPFQEPAESQVVVIGDSFTHYFQLAISVGTGIDALLSKEINIPVSNVSSAGATTAPIKEFLRRPELLRNRRVVVWIVTSPIVSYDAFWDDLPPLLD